MGVLDLFTEAGGLPSVIERWGCSSAGRAPALQAGGQRFDPAQLHHSIGVEMSGILGEK